MFFFCFFFFFKQKTAYEIRPCDWSSDVCSSDLGCPRGPAGAHVRPARARRRRSEERRVGKSVRSCVDLGGRRIIKKKKKKKKMNILIKISKCSTTTY